MLRKSLLVLAATLSAVACGHHNYNHPSLEPFAVEWTTCNLGASAPEETGTYFAWGETAGKDHYSWENYRYSTAEPRMIKYNPNSGTDGPIVLDPDDDAATVLLGNGWRMPTKADWEELQLKGAWKMVVRKGVAGYLVTSRIDGSEVVFLPAAGFYNGGALTYAQAELITMQDGSQSWKGAECHFWTSELRVDYTPHAWYFGLADEGYGKFFCAYRAYGMNIRAVRDK